MGGLEAGKRLMGAVAHVMRAARLRVVHLRQGAGKGGGREFRLCSDASGSASYTTHLCWSVLRRAVLGLLSWGGVPSQNRDAAGHRAK
jgi:hypothetical protein